ncbi:hypothetical protein I307_05642 [Cryptococcus deuterogattii 99/473]|uniref:Uncharacterized protein n=1 Tax=Cryptococcus deuterogattii Ram5 TaxID=1296110 RepID=A0A0D0UTS3_9TREE|nr:hypothetical protein I309_05488 [Cryptococcus deuterogattii LA55]KIR38581.1 hypothetical protein I313_05694 [Cryptococcus deuterogattii Ram5]KIR70565.1 hypothetical protein I310_05816 [Cryptococcus deuterogattii CA1014]KIR90226.1 hypothetical protein I304_05801 [Cryptococcus deuterogattii CBS 10090]KIR96917.1 hypothetical protein L804_05574 [Cryptococcus deuterogattii 2001/935-1]KIY54991.1 hypothetical protein I307_05642 [Cryptococcus deuterogattii 99/473]
MVKTGGNVLIAFAIIHVSMYSLFWGPTSWVILGETHPLRVRLEAIALAGTSSLFRKHIDPSPNCAAASVNWLWNFLLSYFSLLTGDDIGPLYTRGIALEEVDELYRSKVPAWKSSSWKLLSHHAALDALEGESRKPVEGSAQAPDTLNEKKPADEHIENTPVVRLRLGRKWERGEKVLFKTTCRVRQVVVL